MTIHSRGKATRSHNWHQREEVRRAQFDYIRDQVDPGWREREAAQMNHFKYLRAWMLANFGPIVDRFGEEVWQAFWHQGVFGEDPEYTHEEQRAILNTIDAAGIDRFFSMFIDLDKELESTAVLIEAGQGSGEYGPRPDLIPNHPWIANNKPGFSMDKWLDGIAEQGKAK